MKTKTEFLIKRLGVGLLVLCCVVVAGCQQKNGNAVQDSDPEQKQLLQGIWVDPDAETAVFKVEGDTIYYPGDKTQSATYLITQDSIWINGGNTLCYPIEQLTANTFRFRNQYGEEVRLVKSNEQYARDAFRQGAGIDGMESNDGENTIIQDLQKHDTICSVSADKYHAYVCVNPTSYKVIRNTYDTDGVGVGKVYHDNIVNLTVYKGNVKLYSKDFRKQDFQQFIPKDVISQSVLNDINYTGTDDTNLTFTASICMPESSASYQVLIIMDKNGKTELKVR